MWNHAQNNTASGDEDTNEVDSNFSLKDRLERSLDLTHYLKYLDHLFSQAPSESESSDSDEGEGSRTFNDFLQPSAQPQSSERSHYPLTHIIIGTSDSNTSTPFSSSKSTDNFHLDANISSSSLSSLDSGTSSLSMTYSSDNSTEPVLLKSDEASRENNDVSNSPTLNTSSNNITTSNASGPGEEKSGENSSEKDKKSQKKKKSSKSTSESLPRQHKPSSGGKGNGSKGGGGSGGLSTGGASSDASNNSGGSSNQGFGGSNGSPGVKSRSGKQSLQQPQSEENSPHSKQEGEETFLQNTNPNFKIQEQFLSRKDSHLNANINSDVLLTSGDIADNFSNDFLNGNPSVDSFEGSEISSFPLMSILDIQEDEEDSSINEYISAVESIPSNNSSFRSNNSSPSPICESSTNFFTKIAEAAAAASSTFSCNRSSSSVDFALHSSKSIKLDGKKRKYEGAKLTTPNKSMKLTEKQRLTRLELLNAKRRKVYVCISRKEVPKTQRNRTNSLKEKLVMKRKLAHWCARFVRKKALQSQKCMKESVCKAKRLTQEMESHWKLADRVERDIQRKKDRELEIKLKQDLEILKLKKERRKLHCMITQIEYFAAKLLNTGGESEILSNLDDVKEEVVAQWDKNESENIKFSMKLTSEEALNEHHNLVKMLDISGLYTMDTTALPSSCTDIVQPQMFEGKLMDYQVKGMTWMKKLYTKGLNGILADETGLGKKAQVIAFLSHLAELYGLWGTFLIVAPVSSLDQWQQAFFRLSPRFKVIPYRGSPTEKKMFRMLWEPNSQYQSESNFHVVITSYQTMVSDLNYFSNTKWQYFVLDDSDGAVTSSTNWIPVLSFRCRSKLLLTSSPRLNFISHLCSYLYFIMPSLYDLQEELSEWLLKELETPRRSNKIYDDPCQTSMSERLEKVTRHFLLRRLKEDVETELLSHNIDIQLVCPLSRRQRQKYTDVLDKTNLHRVIQDVEKCTPDEIRSRVVYIQYVLLQLRKICNHPDLVEDRGIISPLWMNSLLYIVPELVFRLFVSTESKRQSLEDSFSIYNALNVHNSLFPRSDSNTQSCSTWNFIRLLDMSCGEVEGLFLRRISKRLTHLVNFQSVLEKMYFTKLWRERQDRDYVLEYRSMLILYSLVRSQVLSTLVFTTSAASTYSFGSVRIFPVPDSIEHRTLRSRKYFPGHENSFTVSESKPVARKTVLRMLQQLEYPKFIQCYLERVSVGSCQVLVTYGRGRQSRVLHRTELTDIIRERSSNLDHSQNCLKDSIMENIFNQIRDQRTTHEKDNLITDSGKLKQLVGLLVGLRRSGNRVLIYADIPETIEILQEFLTLRRWRHVKIDSEIKTYSSPETFVYLASSQFLEVIPHRFSIDTIIFYDQDWKSKLDEQKYKLLEKLGQSSNVSCYRLICKGTIEEKLMRFANERNIISAALCRDTSETRHISSLPLLKSLVSVIMRESYRETDCSSNRIFTRENRIKSSIAKKLSVQSCITKANSLANTKESKSETVYGGVVGIFNFSTGVCTTGSDSASPSNSEDMELGELEDEDIKHCEENYSITFDDDYFMGMSPESLEEVVIKEDYEDNSPKKPKLGRGSGKRGRPPSRIRFQIRELNHGNENRRGPGRPRLKPIGPANQGIRGRRPGRPPLTKKAETISSALTPLSSGQRMFGFYSSPDLELS